MHAKPFTLSVVIATVIGGVSLVSARIDQQEQVAAARPVPVKEIPRVPGEPLATASPLDIDPRRMEAPSPEPVLAPEPVGARAVTVSSAN